MDGDWSPPLTVHETGTGCRLVLAGLSHGNGATLQEAADDLIRRLLNLVLAVRSTGLRVQTELGRPDPRTMTFLWELGELSRRGEDIRDRVFGPSTARDAA